MSGNSNTEEGGGKGGGKAGGDWISSFYMPTAVGAGVAAVAFLGWQMYQTNKKMKEMELEIKRSRVYIRNNEDISALSLISLSKDSTEEKNIVCETALFNTVALSQSSKLDELEKLLVERQHVFCSSMKAKSKQEQLEKLENEIKKEASTLLFQGFNVEAGLEKIFKEDKHCGSCLKYLVTRNKRRNGRIMWEQLKRWRSVAEKTIQDNGVKNLLEDP
ncbi:uncharacterized protein PAE49_020487 [Odontesthes bonariensis]|uniref:uncharacterized protein LOC142367654 n=1 Tax=Odontesthes bonariensis TaxID=219752 RepID=UPI003F590111